MVLLHSHNIIVMNSRYSKVTIKRLQLNQMVTFQSQRLSFSDSHLKERPSTANNRNWNRSISCHSKRMSLGQVQPNKPAPPSSPLLLPTPNHNNYKAFPKRHSSRKQFSPTLKPKNNSISQPPQQKILETALFLRLNSSRGERRCDLPHHQGRGVYAGRRVRRRVSCKQMGEWEREQVPSPWEFSTQEYKL